MRAANTGHAPSPSPLRQDTTGGIRHRSMIHDRWKGHRHRVRSTFRWLALRSAGLSSRRHCQWLPLLIAGSLVLQLVVVYRLSDQLSHSHDRSLVSNFPFRSNATLHHDNPPRELRPRNVTLVVGTKGEMANHLNSLAHGLRIKHWIESEYPHLTVQLHTEHREDRKWYRTAQMLTQCFPVLKQNVELLRGGRWMNEPVIIPPSTTNFWEIAFYRGKNLLLRLYRSIAPLFYWIVPPSRFYHVTKIQELWLQSWGKRYQDLNAIAAPASYSSLLDMDQCTQPGENANSPSCWHRKLAVLLQMHAEQDQPRQAESWWNRLWGASPVMLPPDPPLVISPRTGTTRHTQHVTLPYLRTEAWSFGLPFTGEYYDMVRQWFALNHSDPLCCPGIRPDPQEVVWHFRNFAGENVVLVESGFDDVDPTQAVDYLFRPMWQSPAMSGFTSDTQSAGEKSWLPRPGSVPPKIAMLSRYTKDLQPFIAALNRRLPSLAIRVIENGTAASDFCFLSHADLLVTNHLSSFGGWAVSVAVASSSFSRGLSNVDATLPVSSRMQRVSWVGDKCCFTS
jgi:hypothetical protein